MPYLNYRELKTLILLLTLNSVLLTFSVNAGVVPAGVQEVYVAQKTAPVAMGMLQDIAAVPNAAADLLYLPLGVVKSALSILPGPTLAGGLRDIGKGVLGAADLVQQTLKLPFRLVGRAATLPKRLL